MSCIHTEAFTDLGFAGESYASAVFEGFPSDNTKRESVKKISFCLHKSCARLWLYVSVCIKRYEKILRLTLNTFIWLKFQILIFLSWFNYFFLVFNKSGPIIVFNWRHDIYFYAIYNIYRIFCFLVLVRCSSPSPFYHIIQLTKSVLIYVCILVIYNISLRAVYIIKSSLYVIYIIHKFLSDY